MTNIFNWNNVIGTEFQDHICSLNCPFKTQNLVGVINTVSWKGREWKNIKIHQSGVVSGGVMITSKTDHFNSFQCPKIIMSMII
jgi:hypothetical protein